jgi:hypothetical protein
LHRYYRYSAAARDNSAKRDAEAWLRRRCGGGEWSGRNLHTVASFFGAGFRRKKSAQALRGRSAEIECCRELAAGRAMPLRW